MKSETTLTLTEAVAEELRSIMARRRMNQKAVGLLLGGRSQSYVSRRVVGEVPLDLAELETLADALGVSVSEIIADAEAHSSTAGGRRFPHASSPVQLGLFGEPSDLREEGHVVVALPTPNFDTSDDSLAA